MCSRSVASTRARASAPLALRPAPARRMRCVRGCLAPSPLRPRARRGDKEKVREQAAHEEKLYRIKLFEPDLKLLSAATDRRRMRRAWTNDLLQGHVLPHPRSPGGKPQRLTARVKIASARPYFPSASFCRRGQFPICLSVSPCVCPSVRPERRPKFGSKSGARCSFERGNPNFC